MIQSDFLTHLTQLNITLSPQQLTAVQAVEGPVLLLAVPGSGKTTVLVTRLGYMVKLGIPGGNSDADLYSGGNKGYGGAFPVSLWQ